MKELYSSTIAHKKMSAIKLYIFSIDNNIMILDKKNLKYINVHYAEIFENFVIFYDEWLLENGELFSNEIKFKQNDEVLFLEIELKH